jgi:hypothetical protein
MTESHHCMEVLPTEVSLIVKECNNLCTCDLGQEFDLHTMRKPPLVSVAGAMS